MLPNLRQHAIDVLMSCFLFSQNWKRNRLDISPFVSQHPVGEFTVRMLSPENVLRLRSNTLKPSDQPSTTADLAPKTNNHGRSHSTENILSISARRRFSNVSDVVSRKLSNTIGWKIPPPTPVPTQEIGVVINVWWRREWIELTHYSSCSLFVVTQGKCLCGQYIRHRLKRSGVFNKRLALQRIRSIIGTPSVHVVREVFPALNYVRIRFRFNCNQTRYPLNDCHR